MSEEAHLGCADGGVKLHRVADDKEVDESGLPRQDEQEMTAAGPDTLPCGPHGLEKHEIGPAPKQNPGPPFAVGDVIMCNVLGSIKGLQRGFIFMVNHPKYCIQLEEGRTVGTSTGESWLSPCWAPGEFTPDQDDPFVKEKAKKKLKMGSCGIHVDSQLEALRKVKVAKELWP